MLQTLVTIELEILWVTHWKLYGFCHIHTKVKHKFSEWRAYALFIWGLSKSGKQYYLLVSRRITGATSVASFSIFSATFLNGIPPMSIWAINR